MIKFFRRIRKQLLTENPPIGRAGKFSSHLIYTTREILIVLIGILIAIQINNYNEEQKLLKIEINMLAGLRFELVSNLRELNHDFNDQQNFYQATKNVHDYIQKKPLVVDSMYKDFFDCFRFNYFFPETSTYETIKSGNLDIIRSDKLKKLIIKVYESDYQRLIKKIDTRRNAAQLLFPYYQKHFRIKNLSEIDIYAGIYLADRKAIAIPNDYAFLVNDSEYETLIIEALFGRSHFLHDYNNAINDVKECITEIDRYLMNLD